MSSNPNRSIYNEAYVPAQLEFAPKTPYDRKILELRMQLLDRHCTGKDVLDLCCGSGTYLTRLLDRVNSIVGLDFSRNLLSALSTRLKEAPDADKAAVVEGDAACLPFANASFDTVFSLASLYYIPEGQRAISEAGRVLRPGGRAILDLGNANSLVTLTAGLSHHMYGWAKPYPLRYRTMIKAIEEAGFVIEQHHAFQVLPLFGPKAVQLLLPFSLSLFKYPLGLSVRGRLLDSFISGAPLLRRIAFRHLFVLRRVSNE